MLYYKCHHRINFRCQGSNIDFSDWVKKKKKSEKYYKFFHYAITIALSCGDWTVALHPGGVSKIKPFINKYKWKGIN